MHFLSIGGSIRGNEVRTNINNEYSTFIFFYCHVREVCEIITDMCGRRGIDFNIYCVCEYLDLI